MSRIFLKLLDVDGQPYFTIRFETLAECCDFVTKMHSQNFSITDIP